MFLLLIWLLYSSFLFFFAKSHITHKLPTLKCVPSTSIFISQVFPIYGFVSCSLLWLSLESLIPKNIYCIHRIPIIKIHNIVCISKSIHSMYTQSIILVPICYYNNTFSSIHPSLHTVHIHLDWVPFFFLQSFIGAILRNKQNH